MYFDTHGGATIGKRLLKIRVVNKDYQSVNLKTALLRETIGKYLCWITFGIGFLLILINKEKRALSDIIAKTYVVKVDEHQNPQIDEAQKVNIVDKILFTIFSVILFTAGISLILFTYFGFPFLMPGNFMNPLFKDGQIIFVKYPTGLKRSDVVLYNGVINGQPLLMVGRIIARPGETFVLKNNDIYIDGFKPSQARILAKGTKTKPGNFIKENVRIVVPPGKYIVMGDNRSISIDSRDFGFVPANAILAKLAFGN